MSHPRNLPLVAATVLLSASAPCQLGFAAPVSFAEQIQPIFEQSCLPCHNATKAEGGLILESPREMLEGGDAGAALKPGNPRQSLLFLTAAHLKKPFMPPEANKAKAPALTKADIDLLERWIQEGAQGLPKQKTPVAWHTMPAKVSVVQAAALSPDGRFAAVSRGNTVSVYDLVTGAKVTSLTPHPDLVGALAFSPDGTLLATGSRGEIKLWRRVFDDNAPVPDAPANAQSAASPNGSLTASIQTDGTVRLASAKDGGEVAKLGADHALLAAKAKLELSLAGARFEVTFLESELKTLDEKVTKLTADLAVAEKARAELQPKREGMDKTLADTLRQKESLMLERDALEDAFAAATQALNKALEAKTTAAANLASATALSKSAAPDDKAAAAGALAAATAAADKALEAHKAAEAAEKTAKEKREAKQKDYSEAIKAHGVAAGAVSSALTLDRNAQNYARVLAESTVEQATRKTELQKATASVKTLEADVAAATEKALNTRPPAAESLVFSADGSVLFTRHTGGAIRAWSGTSGRPLLHWDTHPRWELLRSIGNATKVDSPLHNRVNALAFSPDGRWIATGAGEPSRSGQLKLWLVESGELVREFPKPHKDAVLSLDFSHDGKWLASGSADRAVRVWETGTGKMFRNLEAHANQVLSVSLRNDGRRIASASADNSVKTWDLQRSDVVATFATFTKEVNFVRYLGRGDELVATSGAPAVKILKDGGGETRAKTDGFTRFVTAGATSPDGALQLVGDAAGVARLLDREGKLLFEWQR